MFRKILISYMMSSIVSFSLLAEEFTRSPAEKKQAFEAWCQQEVLSGSQIAHNLKRAMRRLQVNSCTALKHNIQAHNALWLNSAELTDIRFLRFFPHLERLDLSDNHLEKTETLELLPNLTHLWLGENQITDITAIGKLKHLKLLVLEDNQIYDASILKQCRELVAADLSRNHLRSADFIMTMEKLRYVFLNHNHLTSADRLIRYKLSDSSPIKISTPRKNDKIQTWPESVAVPVDWDLLMLERLNPAASFRIISLDGNPVIRNSWGYQTTQS
ncbi:MAG: leucine-rich repeat domain-containing protein [Deltaproteobacteria bacterium]|nr:leucine-rich repeat domain-containing protein [Deltaproteobacteria bacterium]